MRFEAVIGLEVHAQLQTHTKIFCGCTPSFGDPPNTHTCPVCLGLPGALPVLNAAAVDKAIAAAVALGCTVHEVSEFARKNYFYPDLPKGYQISQYDRPIATGGHVELDVDGQAVHVGITRIHMEEDAGKSLHEGTGDPSLTGIDLNRAGTPLIEIVSEPDLRDAAAAAAYFTAIRDVLVAIDVNDGNLEEGSLRCDANVSVRPVGQEALGTKVEVKNVNSFRYLQKAIDYEIARQSALVSEGGTVVQETRLFDPDTGRTFSMRSKEEAHDYRYFPEPDLPLLVLAPGQVDRIRASLPELPAARRARFVSQYGLPAYDAGVLTQDVDVAAYFEQVAAQVPAKLASNWVMGDLLRMLKDADSSIADAPVTPAALAELLRLVDAGTIGTPAAKQVFETMWRTGEPAPAIVEREGLTQVGDEAALLAHVTEVLAANPDAVASYRAGRVQAIGALVGQVMKLTRGTANPKVVHALIQRQLDA
ncbi:MAG: Asp-tRNA(Asn)/Glu-tRNA(Gln) amidotransferase subunit GatB [Acidobacteria bacterium]|nr:Asp-tRNA(Asn)/Glu-tRNA(Gln) amidotransferase subunit GatB [Acidobacteriota bacterium]